MTAVTKCFVEVFFVHNDFISFDFGNFAIVIGYNSDNNTNNFRVYFKDDYIKKFMLNWAPKIDYLVDSIEINFGEFGKIKETSLKLKEECKEDDCKKLYSLLKKNFPKQIKLYGR